MFMYNWITLLYTKTNTTLLINYALIQNKKFKKINNQTCIFCKWVTQESQDFD